jgi:hypothetical protein
MIKKQKKKEQDEQENYLEPSYLFSPKKHLILTK